MEMQDKHSLGDLHLVALRCFDFKHRELGQLVSDGVGIGACYITQ